MTVDKDDSPPDENAEPVLCEKCGKPVKYVIEGHVTLCEFCGPQPISHPTSAPSN